MRFKEKVLQELRRQLERSSITKVLEESADGISFEIELSGVPVFERQYGHAVIKLYKIHTLAYVLERDNPITLVFLTTLSKDFDSGKAAIMLKPFSRIDADPTFLLDGSVLSMRVETEFFGSPDEWQITEQISHVIRKLKVSLTAAAFKAIAALRDFQQMLVKTSAVIPLEHVFVHRKLCKLYAFDRALSLFAPSPGSIEVMTANIEKVWPQKAAAVIYPAVVELFSKDASLISDAESN